MNLVEHIKAAYAEEQTWYKRNIEERLSQGPASTHELAAACGVRGARVYHRFRRALSTHPRVRRCGEAKGPTGHINIVWEMVSE